MNCTAHSSARASHFFRAEATIPLALSFEVLAKLQQLLRICKFLLQIDKRTRYTTGVPKRYSQYCPIAHALDVVGERWALLIVRDLLKGPKRYTDLAAALPGIGTNILAARLRDLEKCGIVEKRRLDPPAAVTVYDLTPYGRELEEVMHALARWGARSLGPPSPDEVLSPGWLVNAARATFDPDAARGVDETYEVRAAGEVASIRVANERVEAAPGAAWDPDVVIETDPPTLFALVARELEPAAALAAGSARVVEGDPDALARYVSLFSLASRAAATA